MQPVRKGKWIAGAVLVTATVAAVAVLRRTRTDRPVENETRRVRDLYDREATRYDSMIRLPERLLFGDGRIWAASEAMGDMLEIAVGTGRNFPHYRAELRITGQDISPEMLDIARARAQALGREADLRVGDAQALAFAREQFDSVVSTLAHCTIPDDRRAVGGGMACVASGRPVDPARTRAQPAADRARAAAPLRTAGDPVCGRPSAPRSSRPSCNSGLLNRVLRS